MKRSNQNICKKRVIFNKCCFLLNIFIVLLIFPDTVRGYWEIEYTDSIYRGVRSLSGSGNFPKRQGHWDTRKECEEILKKTARNAHMSVDRVGRCVGCDEHTSGISGGSSMNQSQKSLDTWSPEAELIKFGGEFLGKIITDSLKAITQDQEAEWKKSEVERWRLEIIRQQQEEEQYRQKEKTRQQREFEDTELVIDHMIKGRRWGNNSSISIENGVVDFDVKPIHSLKTGEADSLNSKCIFEEEKQNSDLKQQAQGEIDELRLEVNRIQASLNNFKRSLLANNSEFNSWEKTVDDAFNESWEQGLNYFAGLLIGRSASKLGKMSNNRIKEIDNNLDELIKIAKESGDSNRIKNLIAGKRLLEKLKKIEINDGKLIQHFKKLKKASDVNSLDQSDSSDYKKIVNGTVMLIDMMAKKSTMGHVKVIGETYSNICIQVWSWHEIKKLKADNEKYCQHIRQLQYEMNQTVTKMNYLKDCVNKYTHDYDSLCDCLKKHKPESGPVPPL
jgi:hypothetical protein